MSEKKTKLREGRYIFNEADAECEPIGVSKKQQQEDLNSVNVL